MHFKSLVSSGDYQVYARECAMRERCRSVACLCSNIIFVLYVLIDDIQHNSTAFVRPMMLMLDSLSSTNPSNRRAGETWIRSNLKSYPRLLDPLLLVLFDHNIVRNKSEETFHNEYFPVHYYIRNFNQAQVHYVFNTLLTVFRFGGLGFLRSIRQSTIPLEMVPAVVDIVGVSGTKRVHAGHLFRVHYRLMIVSH